MRKIVASFFVSLDGVMESPQEWHFPYFDEEMGQAVGAGFAASDTLLMGRVTYEEWVPVWPKRTGAMADQINAAHKYVVSGSLAAVDWANTTLIAEDVGARIAALKDEPGKDIALSGSATLVEWLLHEGLLDELRLMVHPIVLGRGRRLFSDGQPPKPLQLVASQTFSTGVADLTYRPAD